MEEGLEGLYHDIPDKKHRKRLKKLCAEIRNQMEFYFSDANLHRDRFLRQQIDQSSDHYVDLEVFGNFNKLRMLTSDIGLVAKALSTSELLQVSEDGKKVKRIKPLKKSTDQEERTIYIEYLPPKVDHEWVKQMFSYYGNILYVSLPKYRTTDDIKGFAFVEFDSVEAAHKACEEMNNPPASAGDRPGRFPKSNKQLQQLQRQLAAHKQGDHPGDRRWSGECCVRDPRERKWSGDSGRERRWSGDSGTKEKPASADTSKEGRAKRRRRHTTTSESSIEGDDLGYGKKRKVEDEQAQTESNQSELVKSGHGQPDSVKVFPGKDRERGAKRRQKSSSSSSDVESNAKIESKDNSQDQESKPGQSVPEDECKISKDTCGSESIISKNVKSKGAKKESDEHSDLEQSPKSKKQKVIQESEENPQEEDSTDIKAENTLRKRKHPQGEKDDSESKEIKRVRISDTVEVKENVVVVGKKNRKRKKKMKVVKPMPRDIPELRVIPKKEWLRLKNEYLALQKASVAELKKSLKLLQEQQQAKEEEQAAQQMEVAQQKSTKPERKIEFIPGVIIKVTSEQPTSRKQLKERVTPTAEVAYIDIKDNDCEGYIRCASAEEAGKLTQLTQEGYTFTQLEGDEEKSYWDKLAADRERKLNSKSRTKKRGSQKVMEKAEKVLADNLNEKKHVFFED